MELSLFPLFLLVASPGPGATQPRPPAHRDPHLYAPASGPVLPQKPFVVVWNMPTAHCQKRFDVHLNLRDFDIVENQRQRFRGQKMRIFYRDQLGKYPYLTPDGRKLNGGLPQHGDLAAHLSLARTQISGLMRPNFGGLAVIDWEEWRPLWARNFGAKLAYRRRSESLARRERPELSEQEVRVAARHEFEEHARRFMEETLRLAIRVCPKGLWGFYGFPACFNHHKREEGGNYTWQCHPNTQDLNDRLAWLWRHSTGLYPSIYLPQRLATSPDAALMVRHRLLEAVRVLSTWFRGNDTSPTPCILPYARLAFTHTLTFLNQSDLEHTLGESAALGAAGVVLWGETEFAKSKDQCLRLRDYVQTVLGPYVRTLRSDARSCSGRHCHGNGRCARRHPGSGHMITNSSRHYFLCVCYRGWTGERCEVRWERDQKTKDEK